MGPKAIVCAEILWAASRNAADRWHIALKQIVWGRMAEPGLVQIGGQ